MTSGGAAGSGLRSALCRPWGPRPTRHLSPMPSTRLWSSRPGHCLGAGAPLARTQPPLVTLYKSSGRKLSTCRHGAGDQEPGPAGRGPCSGSGASRREEASPASSGASCLHTGPGSLGRSTPVPCWLAAPRATCTFHANPWPPLSGVSSVTRGTRPRFPKGSWDKVCPPGERHQLPHSWQACAFRGQRRAGPPHPGQSLARSRKPACLGPWVATPKHCPGASCAARPAPFRGHHPSAHPSGAPAQGAAPPMPLHNHFSPHTGEPSKPI